MTVHRIATTLAIAAAAFASIATSAPADLRWRLVDTADFAPTEITSGPATSFGITAEARGPRNGHEGGTVDVFLELSSESLEGASITLVMFPESDPSQREEQQLTITGGPIAASFFLQAWESCVAGPCFEDFRLEVSNATPNTTVTLGGQVRAELIGRDENPEPDSEVLVEITPL